MDEKRKEFECERLKLNFRDSRALAEKPGQQACGTKYAS